MSDLPGPDPLEADLSDPTPLRFTGVRREEPPAVGEVATEEVALGVDDVGLTAIGADGTVCWSALWAEIAALATPERIIVAGGGDAVVMTVHLRPAPDHPGLDHQSYRFVIPTTQPAAVEDTLGAAARYRGIAATPGQQTDTTPRGRRPHFDALGPIGVAIPTIEITEAGLTVAEPEPVAELDPGAEPEPESEPVAEPEPEPGAEPEPESDPTVTAAEPGLVEDTPSVETAWVDTASVDDTTSVGTGLPSVDDTPPVEPAWVDTALPVEPELAEPVLVTANGQPASGDEGASPGWWVVAPAVLVTGAVVAVLLLAAGHVVHL